MPYQVEVKGIDRTNIEPGDVVAVHTKDIGLMTGGNIDDFIDDYYQPPMSRYFATIDVNKVEGIPNLKEQSFTRVANIEYGQNLSSLFESDGKFKDIGLYLEVNGCDDLSSLDSIKNWIESNREKIDISFKYFNYFYSLKDQISSYFALITHKIIIDWHIRMKL